MSNNAKIVEQLNKVLGHELVAINQYFLHGKIYADWGYTKLAAFSKKESIDEMKHADKLIDRILFLKGMPNLQKLGKLNIGENVEEILAADKKLEENALVAYKEAIAVMEQEKDYISRDLLASILQEEEGHFDALDTMICQIKQLGLANFLQMQL